MGVQQYPNHLQDIIDNNAIDATIEEEFEELENWYYSDDFVFWCRNDFWCNDNGLIIAS